MLTSPLNIEALEACNELLQRAKRRKHPSLTREEFIELQRRYRSAHWCPEDKPIGFFGQWAYFARVSKLADPALHDCLSQHAIVVMRPPVPVPPHPYRVIGTTGLAGIAIVERKAKLARKLKALHAQIERKQDEA